jgi:hypothetical protein
VYGAYGLVLTMSMHLQAGTGSVLEELLRSLLQTKNLELNESTHSRAMA